MDRRQFTDAIQFFTLAQQFYADLGDDLVAEECSFAIALAQRVMADAERRSQKSGERATPGPTALKAEAGYDTYSDSDYSEGKDAGMNAA